MDLRKFGIELLKDDEDSIPSAETQLSSAKEEIEKGLEEEKEEEEEYDDEIEMSTETLFKRPVINKAPNRSGF